MDLLEQALTQVLAYRGTGLKAGVLLAPKQGGTKREEQREQGEVWVEVTEIGMLDDQAMQEFGQKPGLADQQECIGVAQYECQIDPAFAGMRSLAEPIQAEAFGIFIHTTKRGRVGPLNRSYCLLFRQGVEEALSIKRGHAAGTG
ncbi:hypothetical protein GCM10023333_42730 [Ferrimonas pelagia]|uniref:Uncharacterized protein n=1 Tax=Ferrimonas pelagia TaxID=1177826 RepID=A0ABP9FJW0_9GAMM